MMAWDEGEESRSWEVISGSIINLRMRAKRQPSVKLDRSMISAPQGELQHVGHLGIDGISFGQLPGLIGEDGGEERRKPLPRQIVPPTGERLRWNESYFVKFSCDF